MHLKLRDFGGNGIKNDKKILRLISSIAPVLRFDLKDFSLILILKFRLNFLKVKSKTCIPRIK